MQDEVAEEEVVLPQLTLNTLLPPAMEMDN